ncbi:DNA modification methylase [Alteraurantiacibacter buctensis]|uniref:Methyltransferase n=1 Tax=Alteraurantiacibacter buctensis TaxID=1503981 RepID=A0A844YT73_9SPHN|nr:DNA methyltransferase [Alteraurantiacibacter buctensis]MXO70260.1 DNA methylase N-4 [Alteraurantiacibacter buctensis]
MKLKPNQPEECFSGHNHTRLEGAAVSCLRVRPGDPKRFSKRDFEIAMAVMGRLPAGAPLPIVVNENGEILVGHLFVEAARRLGKEWVTVTRHAGMSEVEAKKYTIAIDQLLSKGSLDPIDLSAWIREFEVGIENFDHLSIGFDNGELDRILGIPNKIAAMGSDADVVPPVQPRAVSRPGMIWLLGRHRIMCGSATSMEDVAQLMAGHKAAMAITDPPFGCKVDGFVSKKGKHADFVEGAGDKSPHELEAFFSAFAHNLLCSVSKGALVYIFIDWRSLHILLRACEPVFGAMVQMCCWTKDRAGMGSFYRSQHELVLVFRAPGANHHNNIKLGINGRNRSNVWAYPSAASSRSGREGDMLAKHPTPKSVEMIADAILDCTEHGDRIIDCFLGSGTALIAAERTGRICHGMELDPQYVDVAIRRWQDWTGLAAVDAERGRTFDDFAAERQMEEGQDDA